MHNRSIYFSIILKATSYINDPIRQTIFDQLNSMVSYVDIIGLCHSVTILCEIYVIWPCEVAALPFQAHANYGTWSRDFVN